MQSSDLEKQNVPEIAGKIEGKIFKFLSFITKTDSKIVTPW